VSVDRTVFRGVTSAEFYTGKASGTAGLLFFNGQPVDEQILIFGQH